MPQRRLETYFSVPLQRRTEGTKSFLDLPYAIRRQIYILVGLVRFCPIDLNREGLREELDLRDTDWECFYYERRFYGKSYGEVPVVPCGCPYLPSSLLYVSRTVSREIVSILYSENKFTVDRSGSRGLKPLQNLSSEAVTALRSLTIRLNNCSCTYGHSSFPLHRAFEPREIAPCHGLCETDGLHNRPIGNRARQDKALLRTWYELVSSLAPYISPGLMNLSVICDTKDLDTAYQVTAPLSQFPLLKNCSIRLAENLDWKMFLLARARTLELTGQPMDLAPNPSKYHVPEEIIEQILGYTQLIAPFDLEWIPNNGLVPFDCCKKCTDTLDFCSCNHAAYSSTCICWKLPMSIFLTSHAVYRIATTFFYSRNKFVLFPDGIESWCPYRMPTSSQSPLAQFIEALPRGALPHLRHITLRFPYCHLNEFAQNKKTGVKWGSAIDLLARKASLPKLTLILDINRGSVHGDPVLSKAQQLEAYKRMLQPLNQLRGIRNLFVFLRGERSSEFRGILEKSIMGPYYDADANGKLQERRRRWHDGHSQEGPVIGPDGQKLWPPEPMPDEYSSEEEGYYL